MTQWSTPTLPKPTHKTALFVIAQHRTVAQVFFWFFYEIQCVFLFRVSWGKTAAVPLESTAQLPGYGARRNRWLCACVVVPASCRPQISYVWVGYWGKSEKRSLCRCASMRFLCFAVAFYDPFRVRFDWILVLEYLTSFQSFCLYTTTGNHTKVMLKLSIWYINRYR